MPQSIEETVAAGTRKRETEGQSYTRLALKLQQIEKKREPALSFTYLSQLTLITIIVNQENGKYLLRK